MSSRLKSAGLLFFLAYPQAKHTGVDFGNQAVTSKCRGHFVLPLRRRAGASGPLGFRANNGAGAQRANAMKDYK